MHAANDVSPRLLERIRAFGPCYRTQLGALCTCPVHQLYPWPVGDRRERSDDRRVLGRLFLTGRSSIYRSTKPRRRRDEPRGITPSGADRNALAIWPDWLKS